jgi:hypothetical protein
VVADRVECKPSLSGIEYILREKLEIERGRNGYLIIVIGDRPTDFTRIDELISSLREQGIPSRAIKVQVNPTIARPSFNIS